MGFVIVLIVLSFVFFMKPEKVEKRDPRKEYEDWVRAHESESDRTVRLFKSKYPNLYRKMEIEHRYHGLVYSSEEYNKKESETRRKIYDEIMKITNKTNCNNPSEPDFTFKVLDANAKQEFDMEQRKLEEEKRKKEEDRRRSEMITSRYDMKQLVSKWDKVFGVLPVYNLFYYYPLNCTSVYIDSEKQRIRQQIWDFKKGKASVEYSVGKVLKHFLGINLQYVTFVCIPASSSLTNAIRYEDFSNIICKSLSMENAFNHISIIKNKAPSHLGGGIDKDYFTLDRDFFRGKNVIIFDDVMTRGESMINMKNKLESAGANVICGITLGKTVYQDMGVDPYRLLNL